MLERVTAKRARRGALRKAQAALLALSVLAATSVGFVVLREAFGGNDGDVGESPVLAGNGEIVFSREGADGHFHLYAVQPDGSGLRQITRDATDDTDPTVSPGGETIAYVHELDRGIRVIATVPIDGGIVGWHTPEGMEASDPAWSPNGESIAFVGWAEQSDPPGFEAPKRYRAIFTIDATEGAPKRLTDGGIPFTSDPTWSPGDRSIAFAGGSCASSCEDAISSNLYVVEVSSTDVRRLTPLSGDFGEEAPRWSPDGTRIAFTRRGEHGDEVWTAAPDGSDETLVAIAVEASLEPDLAWAPDGSALLVSDGEWIYRVDATHEGDPRENLLQVVEGVMPSWQPLPPGSKPTPTLSPEPSPSSSPEPQGRDIGLGFNLCHAERLGGIDFLGDGTRGHAWIGAAPKEDGSCPEFTKPGKFLVAVDHTGDQLADTWIDLPWLCYNGCALADATDLDANGSEELIVQGYFSILDYWVLAVRPTGAGEMVVEPILVASPGHEPAQITAGEPFRIDAGGDAGYSSVIWCDNYPDDPVIVWAWVYGIVESEQPKEVHITRLQLQPDGLIHILGTNDYTIPANEYWGYGDRTEPACGVDWAYRA